MNKAIFENVIAELKYEFDTHTFIKKFLSMYEKEYVELLYSHINSKNGIFRTSHAQIGKYLARHSDLLNIQKNEKIESENIKNYESENQNWRKVL